MPTLSLAQQELLAGRPQAALAAALHSGEVETAAAAALRLGRVEQAQGYVQAFPHSAPPRSRSPRRFFGWSDWASWGASP
ncbi:hypothetical protein ACFP81_01405 [Deinococcus lacus]|uniref:Uncharacterized protein n=1 Tax=Deinococcus lacus TaxID=392561 RepID=A0ABW1Y926_9DEIO